MDIKFPSGGIVDLAVGVTGVLPVLNGGSGVTTKTGTGNVVLSDSPTLVTPALGTPSALVGTNITGTASGLTAGNVTTNANLTGGVTSVGNAATVVTNANLTGGVTSVGNATTVVTNANLTGVITSVGNATSIASQTGTGSTFVVSGSPTITSPTLTAPVLGTPASGTLTNCTFPTLNQNTTGTAAGLSSTLAIASGGTAATTAAAALTSLGAYPATNPSGYTTNVGTLTSVTGTAPVVSSGGTTPAISMAAASSGVNGYMTGTYATKLDGIATGATDNTGTVTSVSTSGNVSGITLTGSVTTSGTLTLGGAIGTLNQNTTGSSGSCTGNAASATTVSGVQTTMGTTASATNTSSTGQAGPQVLGNGGGGAVWSMHRPSAFGLNIGLDSDNVFRIGGWSASTNRLQMDMTGNLTMAGNVTAYSDERLKKDWAELPDDFIVRLAEIKHGTFTRLDGGLRQVGVSAQSLQSLLPEAVVEQGGYLSVAYGNAALVAVVELSKRVLELEKQLNKI